jgi:hypothetical protein
MYKVDLWVSFNYGSNRLVYQKNIRLPFVPFIGLRIIYDDANELDIEIKNDDYTTSVISYDLEKKQFEVNVSIYWKRPVSDEYLDEVIVNFSGWNKKHNTNIDELKELLAAERLRFAR